MLDRVKKSILPSVLLTLFIGHITFGQNIEEENAQNQKIIELESKIRDLQYTELVQSMSQRSLLTPNYFSELKALIACQAYNFWKNNSHEVYVSHLNVYSALHDANKYLGLDSTNTVVYNQIYGHSSLVVSIEFGNDPNIFYSAGSDGKILKWNLNNLSNPPVILFESNELFRSLDVSYDDNWLLVVTKERGIILINTNASILQTENKNSATTRDTERSQAAMFVPNELKYLTITENGEVKMKGYGIDSVRAITKEKARTISINSNNKEVYVGTKKGVVQIWNEQFEDKYLDLPELYAINALAVSSDQRLLAIGREKGDAIIWDMENKKLVRTISGHQSAITDIDFSPDNNMLVTSSRDHTARIWDIYKTKKLPIILNDHDDWVMTACFDRSGSKILTGSKDKLIRVWPLDPQELSNRICSMVGRNLTPEEWGEYIGSDIPYEKTCSLLD